MQILVDHNLKGLAPLLFETLRKEGWVDLLSLEFLYFVDVGLPRLLLSAVRTAKFLYRS
jgi:hypothetical protein